MAKKLRNFALLPLLLVLFQTTNLISLESNFQILTLDEVSDYKVDRVVYQRIEKAANETMDNSVETLLIIKEKQMYLIRDGFDDPKQVKTNQLILEMQNRLIPDLWVNKIDDKPDYVRTTDRLIELSKNTEQEYVEKNFGEFYRSVRKKMIEKHVNIFKELMLNRKESNLYVTREPIPKRIYDKGETKYSITVVAKTIDGTVYRAEDADGDGITESFSVHSEDGFNWGHKSGPNILFIYKLNNGKEGDQRNTEIEGLIGKLAEWAYNGTPEEEEVIQKTFPKTDNISDMIEDLYRTVPTQ